MSETQPDLREALNDAILASCDSPRICSGNGRVTKGIRCGPCEHKALQAALAQVSALQAEVERLQKGIDLAADEATSHRNAAVAALRERDAVLERLQKVEGEREKGRATSSPGYSSSAPSPQAVSASGEYPSRKHSAVKAIFVAQFHSREEGEKMWADLSKREPWFGVKLASAGRAVELLAEEGIL